VVSVRFHGGNSDKRLNPDSRGQLSVAILSDAEFDAKGIDASSLTLAWASIRRDAKGGPAASYQDVDHDGRIDLIAVFDRDDMLVGSTDDALVLRGFHEKGQPIRGTASIRLVSRHDDAERNQAMASSELSLQWRSPMPLRDRDARLIVNRRPGLDAILECLDIAGRRVFSRRLEPSGSGAVVLDLHETRRLPAGMYLLRLRQAGDAIVLRFVVAH